MSNTKLTQQRLGEYLKYAAGVLFMAFTGGLISSALLDTLGYEDISIRVVWGIWVAILAIYVWNTKQIEYPQHKETPWEARARNAGELSSFVFMGLLWGLGAMVALAMLLQWVLKIDITELRYGYRLVFLAWGGGIVGTYLYYKHKDNG